MQPIDKIYYYSLDTLCCMGMFKILHFDKDPDTFAYWDTDSNGNYIFEERSFSKYIINFI